MRHLSKNVTIALALVAAGFFVAWLRFRPFLGSEGHYTDGASAYEVRDGGPVRYAVWQPPQAWAGDDLERLLGTPVSGRVAKSPDGRFLAFAVGEPGLDVDLYVAELVDGRPVDPRPLAAANSPGDDLAPAFGHGALYFASDRPGGRGGLDLYRAPFDGGRAGAPEPLPRALQSPEDDTDPAPVPGTGALAFSSNRPRADRRRDHDLYLARPAAEGWAVEPLVALNGPGHEREPAFTADGRGVFFASDRAGGAGGYDLYRSALGGEGAEGWVPPVPLAGLNGELSERAPSPDPAGFELLLEVREPGGRGQLARARSLELFRTPGRPVGWLDLLILALLLAVALFAWLAKRWEQLDVVYKCFLVSLLLHLVLAMWLHQVHPEPEPMAAVGSGERLRVRLMGDPSGARARNAEHGGEVALARDSSSLAEAGGAAPERLEASPQRSLAEAAPVGAELARPAVASSEALERALAQAEPSATPEPTRASAQEAPADLRELAPQAPSRSGQAPQVALDPAQTVAERGASGTPLANPAPPVAGEARALAEAQPSVQPGAQPAPRPAAGERGAAAPQAAPLAAAPSRPVTGPDPGLAQPAAPAVQRTGAPVALALPADSAAPDLARGAAEAAPSGAASRAPRAEEASLGERAPTQTPLERRAAVQGSAAPLPLDSAVAAADGSRPRPQPRPLAVAGLQVPAAPRAAGDQGAPRELSLAQAQVGAPERSAAASAAAPERTSAQLPGMPQEGLEPAAASRPLERVAAGEAPTPSAPVALAIATPAPAPSRSQGEAPELAQALAPGGAPRAGSTPLAADLAGAPSAPGLERRPASEGSGPERPLIAWAAAPEGAALEPRAVALERPGASGQAPAFQAPASEAPSLEAPSLESGSLTNPVALAGPSAQAPAGRQGTRGELELQPTGAADLEGARSAAAAGPETAPTDLGQGLDLDGRGEVPASAARLERPRSAAAPALPLAGPRNLDHLAPSGSGSLAGPALAAPGVPAAAGADPLAAATAPEPALEPALDAAPSAAASLERRRPSTPGRDGPRRPGSGGSGAPLAGPRPQPLPLQLPQVPEPSLVAEAPAEVSPTWDRTPYQSRAGAQKVEALRTFGGSEATEAAVAAGLAYLASIQHPDGYWGSADDEHEKYRHVAIGKTGLCLLAFLGAGHTQDSGTEYSDAVARALRFLLAVQDERTGHFGDSSSYSHAIASYAIGECLALTGDAALRPGLERGIAHILRKQVRSDDPYLHGGWGYYFSDNEVVDRWPRASVTAWQVMALESAQLGGLQVPPRAFEDARAFLMGCWDRERGAYRYSHDPGRLSGPYEVLPGSTPASLFALSLMGEDIASRPFRAARNFVTDRMPQGYRYRNTDRFVHRAEGNLYFWYYGTLALFRLGGRPWDAWNEAMKATLLPAQLEDGSWEAISVYATDYAGDDGGDRSYSTALCVLSLEVYYRYFTPLLQVK